MSPLRVSIYDSFTAPMILASCSLPGHGITLPLKLLLNVSVIPRMESMKGERSRHLMIQMLMPLFIGIGTISRSSVGPPIGATRQTILGRPMSGKR